MIRVIGDHENTRTTLHLGQFLGITDDTERGVLTGFYPLFAKSDLQTASVHLHRRDDECRGTSIRQQHIGRFLILSTKIREIQVGGRDLQLWGLGTTHALKLTEVGQKSDGDIHRLVGTDLLTQLLGKEHLSLRQSIITQLVRLEGDGDGATLSRLESLRPDSGIEIRRQMKQPRTIASSLPIYNTHQIEDNYYQFDHWRFL